MIKTVKDLKAALAAPGARIELIQADHIDGEMKRLPWIDHPSLAKIRRIKQVRSRDFIALKEDGAPVYSALFAGVGLNFDGTFTMGSGEPHSVLLTYRLHHVEG